MEREDSTPQTTEKQPKRKPAADKNEAYKQAYRTLRKKGKPQLGTKIDPNLASRLTMFCMRNKAFGLPFQTKEEVIDHLLRGFLETHDTPDRFASHEAVMLDESGIAA